MTLFISENTATLPLGKTYAFLCMEERGKKEYKRVPMCKRNLVNRLPLTLTMCTVGAMKIAGSLLCTYKTGKKGGFLL